MYCLKLKVLRSDCKLRIKDARHVIYTFIVPKRLKHIHTCETFDVERVENEYGNNSITNTN